MPHAEILLQNLQVILLKALGVESDAPDATAKTISKQMEQTSFPAAKVKITDEEVRAWEKEGYPPLGKWLPQYRKQ